MEDEIKETINSGQFKKGSTPWNLNKKFGPLSDKHKRSISESLKGKTPWNKDKTEIFSNETLSKMSKAATGRKFSDKSLQKRSVTMKRLFSEGKIKPMKGKDNPHYGVRLFGKDNPMYGKTHTPESRMKMGLPSIGRVPWNKNKKGTITPSGVIKLKALQTGKKQSPETIEKRRLTLTGKKRAPEFRERMRGDKNPFWKNGATDLGRSIRALPEYHQWVSSCMTRDDWTCLTCRKRGVELNVHHITSFKDILKENNIDSSVKAISCKELWDINNGITLCLECHKQTDTYLNKMKGGIR